jgi:hypothetical protein
MWSPHVVLLFVAARASRGTAAVASSGRSTKHGEEEEKEEMHQYHTSAENTERTVRNPRWERTVDGRTQNARLVAGPKVTNSARQNARQTAERRTQNARLVPKALQTAERTHGAHGARRTAHGG